MPNRILKESVNESKTLSTCSLFAQDLYKRIITYADDYGRFNADTEIMLARLYPREIGSVTQDDVIDGLVELSGIGKIQFYTSSVRKDVYGCFPNWGDHQRLRDSKHKCPDPDDTTVNDWYLRRFIPADMKIQIVERDGFKCKICGKLLTVCKDAKRLVKLGSGLFHIDHTVPCQQGGRATLENLQLTCPTCNLSRKKRFSFEEILRFVDGEQDAASCGEFPQDAARARAESNPIQSESNTESESESAAEPLELAMKSFRDMRKKIKAPMTDKAEGMIRTELQKLAPNDEEKQIAILNQSTMKGWRGVFLLKDAPQQPDRFANLKRLYEEADG